MATVTKVHSTMRSEYIYRTGLSILVALPIRKSVNSGPLIGLRFVKKAMVIVSARKPEAHIAESGIG